MMRKYLARLIYYAFRVIFLVFTLAILFLLGRGVILLVIKAWNNFEQVMPLILFVGLVLTGIGLVLLLEPVNDWLARLLERVDDWAEKNR